MKKDNTGLSSINGWPEADRPRERLFKLGEHNLSNSELLAIVLRTGTHGQSALDLGRAILDKFKTFRNMGHTDISQWEDLKGLGPAKIAQIRAAIEIGRRFKEEEVKETSPVISSSESVFEILEPRMRGLKKEMVKVVLLNSQNKIIDIIEAARGTVNQASPVLREIFQTALQNFAVSIICVHNHPSGDPAPSKEDKDFTDKLSLAGKVLQVNVLDHIIIGNDAYYSFADHNQIIV